MNAPVIIRAKQKHYYSSSCTTENTCHCRSRIRRIPPYLFSSCLLIASGLATRDSSPPSRLKCSSKGVMWICKASFINSSCPLPWSSTVVSSYWIGWWFSHAWSATAEFSIIPFCRDLGVPLVWSLLSVRLGPSCKEYGIPHWIAHSVVMYPWPWFTLSGESTQT